MRGAERFKALKIGVLMGGMSREREISLKTGLAIAQALQNRGYHVTPIDVAADVCLQIQEKGIEVAFIALHGRWGEDGTIQGLLEILRIPYTGSGVRASANAMDKITSKRLFKEEGLPTPPFDILENPTPAPTRPLPLVVKPAMEGSTIGVSTVFSADAWHQALEKAFEVDRKILVEDYIQGREITATILNGEPLPLIHIEPKEGFYDYASKYTPGKTSYHVPADLDKETELHLKNLAVLAYKTLECEGCARVDMMLSEDTEPMILEINTIPGMTPTSLVPKAASAAGMSFEDLAEAILNTASLKIDPSLETVP